MMKKCDSCPKQFPTQSKLQIHQRVHTNEKPYQCGDCGKTFSQSSNLNKHIYIHKPRSFSCDKCEKQFITKYHLKRHESLHQGEVFCDQCDVSFKNEEIYGRHLSLNYHHKNQEIIQSDETQDNQQPTSIVFSYIQNSIHTTDKDQINPCLCATECLCGEKQCDCSCNCDCNIKFKQ